MTTQGIFFGLLNDILPSINSLTPINEELNACAREASEDMNLWPDEAFILKVRRRRLNAL